MNYNQIQFIRKSITTIISVIFLFPTAYSQSVFINSFKTDNYGGPSKTINTGNKLFFSAFDTIHGRELWCTDGTISGTHLIKDINPGLQGSLVDYFEYTSVNLNGIIYFRANDGINGIELWRSDGTVSGTYLVKDINPGNSGSNPGYLTAVNNKLFFTANTGSQLWVSDGTTTGTILLKSFSVASSLYGFNGNLFFSADDANTGQELWKSDGTITGTKLLLDLNGVIGASLPCNFHSTQSLLYFTAATNSGWELWKTNGFSAGTQLVKDINPGGANGVVDYYSQINMTHIGNTLYFRANDGVSGYQLWKSNGSAAGTIKASNISHNVDVYCSFPIVNGKVYFNNYSDKYYWSYDPMLDTITETNYPYFSYFDSYGNKSAFIGDNLYYSGKDSIFGCEVFRSDGTIAGTKIIQETHLTDNWNSYLVQGFNSIAGVLGTKLIFTIARNPYNTEIPLYVYDTSLPNNCDPPSIIVPVPISITKAHFVCNRIENSTDYQFRYKQISSSNWITKNSLTSFFEIQNLSPGTIYEYQVRTKCNGSWTTWSEVSQYNSSFTLHDYNIHILAERSESNTTERIYWLKTPEITKIHLRYRPYNTSLWSSVTNANGFIQLSGLIPGTFYEYQYRAFIGSAWDVWYPANRYFLSSQNQTTSLTENNIYPENLILYPNPATDYINVNDKNLNGAEYYIYENSGKLIFSGKVNENKINISLLNRGCYFICIKNKNINIYRKIIRA
jgi:ELWxxDGT repeat protein